MSQPRALVLPGMFDELPTRREVQRHRAVGMARAAAHAERALDGFRAQARAFVLEYLARHGASAGEVLTSACKSAGIRPPDDRAFGPVYAELVRARLIARVGTVRRTRGHGTAGGNVWALTTLA